ncbi:hypothetical protein [Flavobacterium sp.]|jgi:CRP-like cAMP-binding protein|uniref:hypothetical protein n=1 Tax=Flavobacterium sp. TaxID=239 RepID=UPI00391A8271
MCIKKLDHLILENDMVSSIFFVNEGIIRGYYNRKDQEITTNSYYGQTMITDLIAVRTEKPTLMNFQALQHANCMVAQFSDLDQLVEQYPNLELVFLNF